jgi:DNA polymerase-3 subunit gamma/tau
MDLAGAENIELNEEAAKIIAKNSGGALRDALTILDRAISFSGGKVDKDLVSDMLGLLPQEVVKEAVLAVIKNDGAALHKVFETVQNEGFDAFSLLKDIKNAFGEIFYLSLGTGKEPFPGAKDILNQASAGFIAGLTRKISKLIDEVKFSDTPLLSAEVGLFTIMENTLDIASYISRLETLESGGTGGIHTPAPAEKKSLIRESASVKNTFTEEKPATAPKKTQAASLVVKEGAYKSGLTDTGEMWAAFKKGLAENYPFLYDIAQDVQVDFEAEDSWILKFRAKDDYFKDTFQKRAKDLQETAQRTLGRNIKFGFTLSAGGAPVAKPAYSANTSAYGANASAFKPAVSAPKPAVKVAPAVKEPEIISKEEPFLDGDYSAFAGGESSPEEAGETAKKILNIFDGYIVEAI